jgi:hypothetical protein
MRGRAVELRVFDHGHLIGVMTRANADEPAGSKDFAFRLSIENAEKLIGDLQDALKQAAYARQ